MSNLVLMLSMFYSSISNGGFGYPISSFLSESSKCYFPFQGLVKAMDLAWYQLMDLLYQALPPQGLQDLRDSGTLVRQDPRLPWTAMASHHSLELLRSFCQTCSATVSHHQLAPCLLVEDHSLRIWTGRHRTTLPTQLLIVSPSDMKMNYYFTWSVFCFQGERNSISFFKFILHSFIITTCINNVYVLKSNGVSSAFSSSSVE